jgi:hypothetical protein
MRLRLQSLHQALRLVMARDSSHQFDPSYSPPSRRPVTQAVLVFGLGRHPRGVGGKLHSAHSCPNRSFPRISGLVLEFDDSTVRVVALDFQGPSE